MDKKEKHYAVAPDGRIVRFDPHHQTLKDGWRLATQADIDAQAALENGRAGDEAKAKAAADAAARAASHAAGLAQKQRDEENAARMAAKAAANKQTPLTGEDEPSE